MVAANVVTAVGIAIGAASVWWVFHQVREVVREFEMRLVRRDGKWWVETL